MCPFAIEKSGFMYVSVICKIKNDNCGMWRYCPALNKPIMNDTYNKFGCMIQKHYQENQKDGDGNG